MAFIYLDKDKTLADAEGWKDLEAGKVGPCPHCHGRSWVQLKSKHESEPGMRRVATDCTIMCTECFHTLHYYLIYSYEDTVLSDWPVNVFS